MLFLSSSAASQTQDAVLGLRDGGEIRYGISIPDDARKNQPVPLVIALHYGWSGPRPGAYWGGIKLDHKLLPDPVRRPGPTKGGAYQGRGLLGVD